MQTDSQMKREHGSIRRCSDSRAAAFAFTLLWTLPVVGPSLAAQDLNRPEDPVVLTGSQLPALIGVGVDRIFGYRYSGAGFRPKPIQIDERALVRYNKVYGGCYTYSQASFLAYTDEDTYTGGDPLPNFDADDELVFLARDAGGKAPANAPAPANVDPGSGIELVLENPPGLTGGPAYFYLFTSSTNAQPPSSEVDYSFVLTASQQPACVSAQCTDPLDPDQTYKCYYDTTDGVGLGNLNPEQSSIESDYYRLHFRGRWEKDELVLKMNNVPDLDILEIARFGSLPYSCLRRVDIFDAKHGAFIANIEGPVRAIRSYIGATSGYVTYRTHRFYRQREDVETVFHIHPISGIPVSDLMEYNANALGMTFMTDVDVTGKTVDANGDMEFANDGLNNLTLHEWELLSGPQGSFFTHFRIPVASYVASGNDPEDTLLRGFYIDRPSFYVECGPPCGAASADEDNKHYALSGWRIMPTLPYDPANTCINTDPSIWTCGVIYSGLDVGNRPGYIPNTDPEDPSGCGEADSLVTWRTNYYSDPGLGLVGANQLANQAKNDVELASAAAWPDN